MQNYQKWTLLVFLEIHFIRFGCALLGNNLLCNYPFATQDFQQIVFLTDSETSALLNDEAFKFIYAKNNLSSFGSPALVEFTYNRQMTSAIGLLDIFEYFDQDMRTMVFIAADNVTNFAKMLDDILDTLRSMRIRGIEKLKHAHWLPFYFFIWPILALVPGSNSTNTDADKDISKFRSYLHRFSQHIPLNANVFWIHDNADAESACGESSEVNTGNLKTVWETYSVKDRYFVKRIDISPKHPHFIWQLSKFKWERRGDFNGALIIATGVADPIYANEVQFKKKADGSVELDHGMAVDIYKEFCKHLNFSEKAILGSYMLENVDKSTQPKGMDTQLKDGSADIAITESAVTEDKAEVVQLLHATQSNWCHYYQTNVRNTSFLDDPLLKLLQARFSDPPRSKFRFFVNPFSTLVWATTGVYLVLIIFCIGLYRCLTAFESDEVAVKLKWWGVEPEIDQDIRSNGFSNYFNLIQLDFLWALGTICQQGWYEWPRQTPIKVLFLVASMTGFLLFAAYAGIITSKLSVQDPITVTFENLVNQSYAFYMENDFDFPIDIYNRRGSPIRISTMYTLEDARFGVHNISSKKSSMVSYPEFFLAATRYANYTDAETCSSFTTIPVSTRPNLCAMAVRKLSPFKEIFNVKTLYIWERGILRRIVKNYMTNTQLRCSQDTHTLRLPTIWDLYIAFAAIAYGILVSACILSVEISLRLFYNFIYQQSFLGE